MSLPDAHPNFYLFHFEHVLGRNLHPHESLIHDIEFTARRNLVAEDTATKQTSESRQQKQSHQHDKNSLIRLLPMRERVESLKEQNVSVIILRWTSSSSFVTHSSLCIINCGERLLSTALATTLWIPDLMASLSCSIY